MSQTRVPFKKITEGDFIQEIRRLNRAITKLSYERDDLQQELTKYKERCEKAIEYMEMWGKEPDADMYMFMRDYKEFQCLLKILKGENDEPRRKTIKDN
jgi:hypothetical protein